jgi:hypothetical protein
MSSGVCPALQAPRPLCRHATPAVIELQRDLEARDRIAFICLFKDLIAFSFLFRVLIAFYALSKDLCAKISILNSDKQPNNISPRIVSTNPRYQTHNKSHLNLSRGSTYEER